MSVHIVDDEQRGDRRATPTRPAGSGMAGTSAALALHDDAHRPRLRRLPSHGQENGKENGHYGDKCGNDEHDESQDSQIAPEGPLLS